MTRTVAVILPDIRNARYCDLYSGILRSLEERGYSARLFLTDNVLYREQRAIDGAIAAKACAILTVTCLPDAGSPVLCSKPGPDAGAVYGTEARPERGHLFLF